MSDILPVSCRLITRTDKLGLNPREFQVLLLLQCCAHLGLEYPGTHNMADTLGLSHRRFLGVLERLEQGGFIERRPLEYLGRSNYLRTRYTFEGLTRRLEALADTPVFPPHVTRGYVPQRGKKLLDNL